MNSILILAKNLRGKFLENSPHILSGLAVAGLISTTTLAIRATPKALLLIESEEHELNAKLTTLEIIKLTWKCYVPACAVGLTSIFCIIQANSISLKRNAAIASMYTLTEAAFQEYQAKVVETIGKNKELKIRDDVSSDKIKNNPHSTSEIIFTGKGEVLCYDSLTGRYFKSSIEQIRQAINTLNKHLMSNMFITLNELYYAIGLSSTELGDLLGWNIEKGLIEPTFSTQISDMGEPCLVISYNMTPKFI